MNDVYLSSNFRVRLEWFSKARGGRKNGPPSGRRYTPTIVFMGDLGDLDLSDQESFEKHHSTVFEFLEDSIDQTEAWARFLSPSTFLEFLKSDSKFYIMEGSNAVGAGKIL